MRVTVLRLTNVYGPRQHLERDGPRLPAGLRPPGARSARRSSSSATAPSGATACTSTTSSTRCSLAAADARGRGRGVQPRPSATRSRSPRSPDSTQRRRRRRRRRSAACRGRTSSCASTSAASRATSPRPSGCSGGHRGIVVRRRHRGDASATTSIDRGPPRRPDAAAPPLPGRLRRRHARVLAVGHRPARRRADGVRSRARRRACTATPTACEIVACRQRRGRAAAGARGARRRARRRGHRAGVHRRADRLGGLRDRRRPGAGRRRRGHGGARPRRRRRRGHRPHAGRRRRPPVRPTGDRRAAARARRRRSSRTPPRPTARSRGVARRRRARTPSTRPRTSAGSATAAPSSPPTPSLAASVRRRRAHGMTEQYVHVDVSQNFRMSELEAAWLRLQLPDLARRQRAPARHRRGATGDAAPELRWQADHPRPRRPPVRGACRRPRAVPRRRWPTAVSRPASTTRWRSRSSRRTEQFARPSLPGGRGVGGRVRVAAVLPRADRRRGRTCGRRRWQDTRRDARATREVRVDLGVLPLLQRRARDPDDGPRRAPRARRQPSSDFEIIVVDDGSRDGSVAVLDALQAEVPELRIVEHETNRGYGGALLSGFAAATQDVGLLHRRRRPVRRLRADSLHRCGDAGRSTSCRATRSAAATRGTAR